MESPETDRLEGKFYKVYVTEVMKWKLMKLVGQRLYVYIYISRIHDVLRPSWRKSFNT